MTRARYQKGSLKQVVRKSGRKVWVFRWRETDSDGRRVPRKLVVGTVRDLPNEKSTRERLQALNVNINLDLSEEARPPRSFSELVDHYWQKELVSDNERKAYSTRECYKLYLTKWIVPRWSEYTLAQIENGIAVHVEEWLATLKRSRGTKAKIRNIMSAVCTHAIRYGWMKLNPIRAVRQSAKRERVPVPLTAEELQRLFAELGLLERTVVLVDLSAGMRRGELLALQWQDVDFGAKTVNVRKSIWQQHLGPVKTEESEKVMPLDDETLVTLQCWREETPYAADADFIFASARMHGRQPLWPEALMRNHIAPAAKRAGITKHLSWHVFRHTFSTMLAANGEDVKTVQSLLRHANPSITMGIYTHAVSAKKREAQSRFVEMVLPEKRKAPLTFAARGGTA
jgi:integrase